jgi:hypothetical protein
MLRGPVKHLLSFVFSNNNCRVFYVGISFIYERFVLFHFWAPMPYVLWNVQQPQMRILLYGKNQGNKRSYQEIDLELPTEANAALITEFLYKEIFLVVDLKFLIFWEGSLYSLKGQVQYQHD